MWCTVQILSDSTRPSGTNGDEPLTKNHHGGTNLMLSVHLYEGRVHRDITALIKSGDHSFLSPVHHNNHSLRTPRPHYAERRVWTEGRPICSLHSAVTYRHLLHNSSPTQSKRVLLSVKAAFQIRDQRLNVQPHILTFVLLDKVQSV